MSFFSPSSKLSVKAKTKLFEQQQSHKSNDPSSQISSFPHIRSPKNKKSAEMADSKSLPAKSPRKSIENRFQPVKKSTKDQPRASKGFLSPSVTARFLKGRKSPKNETIDTLERQIEELRHRIKILDGDTGRDELLDLVNEKSEEIQRKEEKLLKLNDKLHHIQGGLSEIEQERQELMAKCRKLESEKRQLEKDLENREREIDSLSRRCASQSDKMKEVSKIRSANKALEAQVSELQQVLMRQAEEIEAAENRQRALSGLQEERELLLQRLESVNKDYVEVSENLRVCLLNVQKLTDEKKVWEEEKRRLTLRSELDLEKLRLEHEQRTIQLEEDLKSKESKVAQLEKRLDETSLETRKMQQQLLASKNMNSDVLSQLHTESDKKLSDMERMCAQRILEEKEKMQQELRELSAKRDALELTMVENHGAEILTLKSSYEEKIRSLLSEVEVERKEWQEKMHQLNAQFEENQMQMEQKFEERLKQLEADHKLDSDRIRADYGLKIEELELNYQRRLQDLEAEYMDRVSHVEHQSIQLTAEESKKADSKIQSLQEEHERLMESYESKILEKDRTIESLEDDLAWQMEQLMVASSTIEKMQYDSKLVEDLTADIEALQSEQNSMTELMEEKDLEIAELTGEIYKMEIEMELLSMGTKNATAVKEQLQACQEEKYYLRRAFEEQINLLEQNLQDVERQKLEELEDAENRVKDALGNIQQLEEEVESARQQTIVAVREMQLAQDEIIASLRQEISQLKKEAEKRRLENAADLKGKEDSIASLREQLHRFHAEASEREQSSQNNILSLTKELQKVRTEVALKNDEIRDLRVIDLPERDETIESLQTKLHELSVELTARDAKVAELKSIYESKVEKLQTSLDYEKSRFAEKYGNLETEISRLSDANTDIKRELEFARISIKDYERKLQDSNDTLESLSNQNATFGRMETELRNEIRKLRDCENELKIERDKLSLAVSKELERSQLLKTENSDLMAVRQTMERDLKLAESKLCEHQDHLSSLEAILEERTKLLGAMVEHNKTLESRLGATDSCTATLQLEASDLRVKLLDREDAIRSLKVELKEKEESYQKEKDLRELAETDLATAQAALQRLRNESKDTAELEKEIEALKEKVQRQELFLKRKLKKDKVLRERQQNSMTTAIGKNWKSKSSQNSRATPSTVSDSNSLDWDLENLLAN